ncbi:MULTISPECIES: hypothetical protein [unclassified Pseudomonas]|uniref:hypothetical protein n=1 Tax=unclassified Pseudomonas TaxID=196821 RepID=UPI001B32BC6A|nr:MULTISPECIES: hypothetical protein [unclassified Pseudomonas]MBP5947089.1 hypothetical protein [Pseudomonas sp. P9(2020)]MBZ9565242.1 hypothetical protein [Pseudomonas sp. P116]
MSPKIPRKPSASTTDIANPAARPSIDAQLLSPSTSRWPFTANISNEPDHFTAAHVHSHALRQPDIVVREIPGSRIANARTDNSISRYGLSTEFLRGLQAANADGFRFIVGRRFVDIEHDGAVLTAHVQFDETLGTCQAKLLTERVASGPHLLKNAERPTWRLATPAAEALAQVSPPKRPAATDDVQPGLAPKRPRGSGSGTRVRQFLYDASRRSPDAQGYFELSPRNTWDQHPTTFAFKASGGDWILVDAPQGGFGAQPTHLQRWTDMEIWELYGIHGEEIRHFRSEAQTLGKPPQWVEADVARNATTDLLRNAFRWLSPTLDAKARAAQLQSYNLLPSQLLQLQLHLKTDLSIPQWVLAHKQRSEDLSDPQSLTKWSEALINELSLKRGNGYHWYDPETCMTRAFREALLMKMGYRRNLNNCLYRTDVPALFRGDDRTPFELANDDAMLPRYHHQRGGTTHKPLSATFSLNEALMYGSAPDPEYLLYNTQKNKYPGKSAAVTDSDNHSSDSDSSASSDWSDADNPVSLDKERNYETVRERQSEMFIYALDTRTLEVVPNQENRLFNWSAQDTGARFPDDDFEGLISVTRSGLDSDRIWLLNSSLTKGAAVQDIADMAGDSAGYIERKTHAGHATQLEYDRLIDEAEAAGRPILSLSGNKTEWGDDIHWP